MAFTPNIDYVGHQRLRQRGLQGVTQAKLQTKLRAEAEARRAAAAAASKKKKSGMGRKIVGAVARGAAAYYTGGASEASGVGAMIDQQIQGGADYERNEYGDIVGAASTMSGMMTAKTANAASTRLNAQSARDDAMQERMDKISPEAGLAFAEKRGAKDKANREIFDEYKGGFLNFGKDIDGLDLDSTVMDYSGIKKSDKVKPADVSAYETDDRGGSGYVSTMPIKPSGIASGVDTATQELLEGKDVEGDPADTYRGAVQTGVKPVLGTGGGGDPTASTIITEDSMAGNRVS